MYYWNNDTITGQSTMR